MNSLALLFVSISLIPNEWLECFKVCTNSIMMIDNHVHYHTHYIRVPILM